MDGLTKVTEMNPLIGKLVCLQHPLFGPVFGRITGQYEGFWYVWVSARSRCGYSGGYVALPVDYACIEGIEE